jgi:hypothetical protein
VLGREGETGEKEEARYKKRETKDDRFKKLETRKEKQEARQSNSG